MSEQVRELPKGLHIFFNQKILIYQLFWYCVKYVLTPSSTKAQNKQQTFVTLNHGDIKLWLDRWTLDL